MCACNKSTIEKIQNALSPLAPGAVRYRGYLDGMIRFPIGHQLLDEATWKMFVDQFRLHSDSDNCWRGEYWGKMMRGGCMTYACTKDGALYRVLEESVRDLLSTQDERGRITTYPAEKELCGWDLWVRKYVMLGLLYFFDICKNKKLKEKILTALQRHADAVVEKVGPREGQIPVLETSAVWGGMNSASILEPFVLLYEKTGMERYLAFARSIADTGLCSGMDLIDTCLHRKAYPYQFRYTKAYEMMSCFEGLLELYQVTGIREYRDAAVNFADMVAETDITIIGCAGCTHELFDHSAVRQTEPSDTVMQETCVTVTWMKLNYRLLLLTGESRYADRIEQSALNAMAGALNSERQTMFRAKAMVYTNGEAENVPHEPFPFDSYSPLFNSRRGEKVGGFKRMQQGRSYGCCACIGSAGTAIAGSFGVLCGADAVCINLYNSCSVRMQFDGAPFLIGIHADLYKNGHVRIRTTGKIPALRLRIPAWSRVFRIAVDGKECALAAENGYVTLPVPGPQNQFDLFLDDAVKVHRLNGKFALTKGPFVLAADKRFQNDLARPVRLREGKHGIHAKRIPNTLFHANLTLDIPVSNGKLIVCDYAEAGKNYDEECSGVSVWIPEQTT